MNGNRMKSTYMLRIIAGAYLIYLAYSLIAGYVRGESPAFWTALAGAAFGIIGAGLLYFSAKGWLRCSKEEKEEQQTASVPELETGDVKEEAPEPEEETKEETGENKEENGEEKAE